MCTIFIIGKFNLFKEFKELFKKFFPSISMFKLITQSTIKLVSIITLNLLYMLFKNEFLILFL